jgi:hypothetical protein
LGRSTQEDHFMKTVISLLAVWLSSAFSAQAASCGTFAVPLACSISVGVGNTSTFTIGNFSLTNANETGSGNLYQPSDVDIDLATGGGSTMLLTFSKNPTGPTPGAVFLANLGDVSQFILNYTVTLSTAAAGTVAFSTPATVNFGQANALGNAFSQSQMILDGTPGTSCLALKNANPGTTQGTCNLPGALGLVLNVHDIVTLNGGNLNPSNTSFTSITNLLSSEFTPDTSGVPEPSTFALIGLGLAAVYFRKRQGNPAK